MQRKITAYCVAFAGLVSLVLCPDAVLAADLGIPSVSLNVGGEEYSSESGGVASIMKILAIISAMTFIPAMVLTMTCFTRISVVLGMTRTALGTQQLPPNMVITGLSLFLTIAIMNPVFTRMYDAGIEPYMDGRMDSSEAIDKTFAPMKKFLVAHAREKDLALFLEITHSDVPESAGDVPFTVAVPAFVLSELNIAFQIGFLIALPFLVLDMVVSSVLTSMSMITLPPVVISLPLKLMLFVVVDGWHLIISSVVQTYNVS